MFAEAVALDDFIRDKSINEDVVEYCLHRRRIPLSEAVALAEQQIADDALQHDFGDAFNNECEGHCGI